MREYKISGKGKSAKWDSDVDRCWVVGAFKRSEIEGFYWSFIDSM